MKNRLRIAGFVTCALLVLAAQQTVTAQARQPESHKWEYCAVTDSYGTGARDKVYGMALITYFEETGDRTEYVRVDLAPAKELTGRYDIAQKRAFAKALAKLGNDEWELVGSAPSPFIKVTNPTAPEGVSIFFKRPKRP